MQTKTFFLLAAMALSSLPGRTQTTVEFMAAPGQRDVLLESNEPVPDGNYVSVGYFDAGFDVFAKSKELDELYGAWHEFGSAEIQTIFGQPGRFADTQSSTDAQFNDQKIWLWVFKTRDNAQPQSGDWGATLEAYGLFSSTAESWTFPVQGTLPPENMTQISSSDINQAAFGSFNDPQHLFLSAASAVPEPSTTALLLLGLGGMLAGAWKRWQSRC